jgi:hypothetical protein
VRARSNAATDRGDPLSERRQERQMVPLFEAAAREVNGTHSQKTRNAKCAAQWQSEFVVNCCIVAKPEMSPAISDGQHFDWALREGVTMLRRVA